MAGPRISASLGKLMADSTGPVRDYAWYEEQATAWALGTISPADRADFERFMATSPDLQAEIASLMPGARALPLAAEERSPSADLRNRLATAINAEPNVVHPAESVPAAAAAPKPPLDLTAARNARVWTIDSRFAKMAAAIALILIGSLIAWNFSLRNDNSDVTPKVVAELGPVDPANDTGASGEVKYQASDEVLLLSMNNLPALSENEVYQVWFITNNGSAPVPSVTFKPNADGSASAAVTADPSTFDMVAITREPGPIGSTAPTTQPFLAAQV